MIILGALAAAVSIGLSGLLVGALTKAVPPALRTTNYRGREVPISGGLVLVSVFALVNALIGAVALIRPAVLEGDAAFSAGSVPAAFLSADNFAIVVCMLGFFVLGLLDDISHDQARKGLKGHFDALKHGEVTPGALKAIGGGVIGFLAGALWERQLFPALLDGLVIAAAANFVNLLDLRPGRATKWFLVIWLLPAVVLFEEPFLPISAIVAATMATWLGWDLKERGMLGDSGANPLGALLGVGFALMLGVWGKVAAAGIFAALTFASERFSYGDVIEKVRPLKWFDELGRARE